MSDTLTDSQKVKLKQILNLDDIKEAEDLADILVNVAVSAIEIYDEERYNVPF